jgi:hypothetical protein
VAGSAHSASVRARCAASRAWGGPTVVTVSGPTVGKGLTPCALGHLAPHAGMRCPADHPWARRPPTCLPRRSRARRRAHRGRSDDRCNKQQPGPAKRATCHTTDERIAAAISYAIHIKLEARANAPTTGRAVRAQTRGGELG